MNLIRGAFELLSVSGHQAISHRSSSVFTKPQKKMDPEVAKIREMRKRRRLEREIQQIKQHAKKPKPVEEMTISIVAAKNLQDRYRPATVVPEHVEDERSVIYKRYGASRSQLAAAETRSLRDAIARQERALDALRTLDAELYAAAVRPDDVTLDAAIRFCGAPLTPPLEGYVSPDGDYADTTRKWT